MAYYRLYFLTSTRGQITDFRDFEAADDVAATARAEKLRRGVPMELWCMGRRVGQWDTAAG